MIISNILKMLHHNIKTGWYKNILAFLFVVIAYGGGILMLFSTNLLLNVIGVLLTTEALIISAYLLHEFCHGSIFKSPKANKSWGSIMAWINGSCYSTFEEVREKHIHHHVDRADVLTFNVQDLMGSMPSSGRRLIMILEWVYIPALEILMHYLVVVLPFIKPRWYHKRLRILIILVIRSSLFLLMAYISIKAWILYLVAYCLMLTALRFVDAFQHTYDVFLDSEIAKSGGKVSDGKLRNRAYEQANTFSNLLSIQCPWLNLLFLNFPYHNAHHEVPLVPWYDLPGLHKKMFGITEQLPVVSMTKLLYAYHHHRLTRLQSCSYGIISNQTAESFIGAAGVSFLTAL